MQNAFSVNMNDGLGKLLKSLLIKQATSVPACIIAIGAMGTLILVPATR